MLTGTTSAVTIIGVTASTPSQLNAARTAINMVDGSDFNAGAGTVGTDTDDALWVSSFLDIGTNTDNGLNVAGTSVLSSAYTLTFDLGANYDLNDVFVWNWNSNGNLAAGVTTMEILVAFTAGGQLPRLVLKI